MTEPTDKLDYISGLDLGQAQDFTALAVLERKVLPNPDSSLRPIHHYAVRHLQRFPLGTAYTSVCASLETIFQAPQLQKSHLAVDQTGVGRPVLDMLRKSRIQARIRPVTITGGHKATSAPCGGWMVPKKELVSNLQVLLQSRRIKVAPSLPEARTLVAELQNFQVKITQSANETFGACREGTHDDLVLAVAIAAWQGENLHKHRLWCA